MKREKLKLSTILSYALATGSGYSPALRSRQFLYSLFSELKPYSQYMQFPSPALLQSPEMPLSFFL